MELRRIEGVLLQEAVSGNLERETIQKTRILALKLISKIPDVIKGMLLNQKIRGRVIEVGREFVLLKLDNGEEIFVANALSTGLGRGEEVTLQLINRNPYIFKVISSKRFLKATESVLRNLNNFKGFPFRQIKSFQNFANSGLFYENKLLKGIVSGNFSGIYEDAKYQAMVRKDAHALELITFLQLYSLEQKGRKILLPIEDRATKGRFLVKKLQKGFRFTFELSFPEGKLLLEVNAPQKGKPLDLKLVSTDQSLLEKLGNLEELKSRIPIGRVERRVVKPAEIEKAFIKELTDREVLNLKV